MKEEITGRFVFSMSLHTAVRGATTDVSEWGGQPQRNDQPSQPPSAVLSSGHSACGLIKGEWPTPTNITATILPRRAKPAREAGLPYLIKNRTTLLSRVNYLITATPVSCPCLVSHCHIRPNRMSFADLLGSTSFRWLLHSECQRPYNYVCGSNRKRRKRLNWRNVHCGKSRDHTAVHQLPANEITSY
jgi:hypothetical protein